MQPQPTLFLYSGASHAQEHKESTAIFGENKTAQNGGFLRFYGGGIR